VTYIVPACFPCSTFRNAVQSDADVGLEVMPSSGPKVSKRFAVAIETVLSRLHGAGWSVISVYDAMYSMLERLH
jgi:hypothetical protein